eukprot:GFUD01125294.1.p1 GENE.GFUD01125294.1~~GFUD01125294.1.p1  ORF type:complete len:194 (+),score=17.76 GFUD01125294.1:31-612(+)
MKIAQAGFITCFLICGWVDNAWAGSERFELKEPIAIKKNNQIGSLPFLAHSYGALFDVLINSKGPTKYWKSIFALKKVQDSGDPYGQDTPQVFLNNDGKGFYICSSRNGAGGCYTDPIDRDIGKWYHVEISQTLKSWPLGNQFEFEVKIDNQSVFTVNNTKAEQFSNVAVLAGNRWWEPMDGLIKNIVIGTYN